MRGGGRDGRGLQGCRGAAAAVRPRRRGCGARTSEGEKAPRWVSRRAAVRRRRVDCVLPALRRFRGGDRRNVCGDRSQSGIRLRSRPRRAHRRCPDGDDAGRRRKFMIERSGGLYRQILHAIGATTIGIVAVLVVAGAALNGAGVALAQSPDAILMYSGPDRAQRLIEGARREGQVVIYAALIQNQAMRPIADGFGKKYPFVRLTTWRADSEDIVQKAAAEVRADNVVADLIEGTGAGEQAVAANIARPFYSPAAAGFPEAYRNSAGLWAPTRLSYYGIAYNTKMVPPEKVPRSYGDLLDPQWKGRMAWRIGSSTGTPLFLTNLRLAWGEARAMAYFDKLKEQKIVNFGAGSSRTLVDRVIAGEYAIALNIFAHHPLISKGKGAPVNSQLMDPVASTAATMSGVKGLHYPYGAILLADYILSKEGQGILARAEYFPVDPNVAPLPILAPVVPSIAGVPENFVGPDKLIKYTESSEDIFQKLFR